MPINITMPALSPTMTDGTLSRWLKAEGDTVESGDVLCEIETDKATMEVEAVDEGILGKILVAGGTENVPVNDVIAVLLEDGESADDISDVSTAPAVVAKAAPQAESKPQAEKSAPVSASAPTPTPTPQNSSGDRVFASPLARRLAQNAGIDLANIKGSGPHGRIVKADIENAGTASAASTTQAVTYDDPSIKTNVFGMAYTEIPNNNIRKVVARRLSESKQTVPHFYLTVECILDNLLAARKDLNDAANGAYKISVNDFIIKASAAALKAYPAANVSWTDDAIQQFVTADISVAVSTPTGLITPIIKAAEDKGLRDISVEMKDLAGRAREGKLKPEEFQGGSFSISNLGMFGVKEFAAIVNPPQGCILAVGAGEPRPVVIDGKIEIRTVMNCTLSVDHRSVDGAVGAEFLKVFKQYIENPVAMLV
ncbi:MAG: pyruvate dehydrogenase complex dihydrolipoamide acetyltransferase [Alphaproteobacteria bacterium]|nr:MAG: pyruvate dehydrogenase complex dihydrolipoamide acetyltransferase [Alphaproteobacteria bacterium]